MGNNFLVFELLIPHFQRNLYRQLRGKKGLTASHMHTQLDPFASELTIYDLVNTARIILNFDFPNTWLK